MASSGRKTILIVDDKEINRAILSDMLDGNYNIVEAANGKEAVSYLQQYGVGIQLVLLDIQMPEMNGYEVLDVMNKQRWIEDIPVIVITSETDSQALSKCLAYGVIDFIERPFDRNVVQRRVNNTLMLYTSQQELADMVEAQIRERENSVNLMISILSHIVEFRNGESGLHVQNVNAITECLLNHIVTRTDKYNLTRGQIDLITMASSLHDIGKISIPEEVLNKPGKLTDEEFEQMKQHSAIGAQMLENLPSSKDEPLVKAAYEIARWHHERYDGRGYPDGLKGDDIPISAQVVALADVYDALTSERIYKPAFSHEKAMEMILNGECGAFNPFLLECLKDAAEEIRKTLGEVTLAGAASHQARKEVDTIYNNGEMFPSSHAFDMLEYSRIKHEFFAIMSNEIQFEFTEDPPILVISDWSDSKIGLDEVIRDPFTNDKLIEIFGKENLDAFEAKMKSTSPEDPIFQYDFQANVNGEPRWYHLAARAMWSTADGVTEYKGFIGKMVDIQESQERIKDLEQKATKDSLTHLSNHAYARNVITNEMRKNPEDMFILIILDMDNFKNVNDTQGHWFGDEVLQELSNRIRESVREDDVVSRLGGDEFMICMRADTDPEPLVERIYNSLIGEYKGYDISISMGVVCANGEDADYERIFRQADHALYEMKNSGRGGYVFATDNGSDDDFLSTISEIDKPE